MTTEHDKIRAAAARLIREATLHRDSCDRHASDEPGLLVVADDVLLVARAALARVPSTPPVSLTARRLGALTDA